MIACVSSSHAQGCYVQHKQIVRFCSNPVFALLLSDLSLCMCAYLSLFRLHIYLFEGNGWLLDHVHSVGLSWT